MVSTCNYLCSCQKPNVYVFPSSSLGNAHPLCLLPSDPQREALAPSLLLVLKWGGELTPDGRVQAEELGRAFRCMYPGGQGKCWKMSAQQGWDKIIRGRGGEGTKGTVNMFPTRLGDSLCWRSPLLQVTMRASLAVDCFASTALSVTTSRSTHLTRVASR